ncbi:fibronectin type III domain-containing protein [Amycolatopsis sp. GM8]|uniref:fibronectin type III domain-containing protein n=1 Tax=Amycolatopsis sp. GM8 TaxID=2896530 RepID=UPI001F34C3B2|nr:fibronectin type III domain-containing protein [Amycolatopsis sp. GM8]
MTDETSRATGRRLVATSDETAKRKPRGWRTRGPFAFVLVLCVVALVAALTGAAQPLLGTPFALSGHWVYNSVLNAAFHVDGATANIDAQVPVPADPGSQVVQGETSGYVVGSSRITEFGKSTLSVESTTTPPANEIPVGLEVTGGPYLVYRNAGKVVRLGDPSATLSAGGPVGDPVATPEGAVWLYRTGTGLLCQLPKGADRITSCPVASPRDHAGALTVIGDRPALVDLTAGTVQPVDGDRLGAGVSLGVPVSAAARPAANDVAGRVAILDPAAHRLILADTANPPAKPVTVALPNGDYDGPVSTGSAVAVVDRTSGNLLTFGVDGSPKDTKPLPHDAGAPRLSRGEDSRAYVEDAAGTHVLIVAKDGKVQDVPVTGKQSGNAPAPQTHDEPNVGPVVNQPQGERPEPGHQPSRPPAQPSRPPTQQKPPPAVPASPPGAPSSVSASAGDGSATVTWGAAADNRSPITSYRVSWTGGSTTVGGGARSAKITGLANGTRYVFTVTATNRVGTGPGASANPVTPQATASPAAAPVALSASYDVNDRPTRDVTLSWKQPALNGGTLVHYLVSATGQADRQVTGTQVTYAQMRADQVVTYTVRAVTRTPDGKTLTGQPASKTVQDTQPTPKVTIAKGAPMSTGNCDPPNCYAVNVTMTGFSPNTTYKITLHSNSNNNVWTESAKTDSSGNATHNTGDYDVPGQQVWVTVGGATSNKITWS